MSGEWFFGVIQEIRSNFRSHFTGHISLHVEWLQCNSVEKYERYREKNVEAKRKVEEAKRMSNFKWGQDFDRSYEENKKK